MNDAEKIIGFGILGAKFGAALGFCYLYFSGIKYFETNYLGFAMGAGNVAGRFSCIIAPMIAE